MLTYERKYDFKISKIIPKCIYLHIKEEYIRNIYSYNIYEFKLKYNKEEENEILKEYIREYITTNRIIQLQNKCYEESVEIEKILNTYIEEDIEDNKEEIKGGLIKGISINEILKREYKKNPFLFFSECKSEGCIFNRRKREYRGSIEEEILDIEYNKEMKYLSIYQGGIFQDLIIIIKILETGKYKININFIINDESIIEYINNNNKENTINFEKFKRDKKGIYIMIYFYKIKKILEILEYYKQERRINIIIPNTYKCNNERCIYKYTEIPYKELIEGGYKYDLITMIDINDEEYENDLTIPMKIVEENGYIIKMNTKNNMIEYKIIVKNIYNYYKLLSRQIERLLIFDIRSPTCCYWNEILDYYKNVNEN